MTLQERMLSLAKRIAMPMQQPQKGMALSVGASSNSLSLTLLDPTRGKLLRQMILGTISLYHSLGRRGVWVVDIVAAEKGYGPLLYQLALSYVEEHYDSWVAPSTDNSPDARKVWLHCYTSSEYEKEPLHTLIEGADAEESSLNHKYRIKNGPHYYDMMERFTELARERKKSPDRLVREVETLALKFFGDKYHGERKVAMPMKTLPELQKEKIGLFIQKHPDATWFFLIDTEGFRKERGCEATPASLHRCGNLDEQTYFRGYIQIEAFSGHSDLNLWEVMGSEATHGYGPLLYQIAMSYLRKTSANSWLVGNITGDLSNDARRLWDRIYQDVRFEKTPLDDATLEAYDHVIDDEDALKYMYRIRSAVPFRKLLIA